MPADTQDKSSLLTITELHSIIKDVLNRDQTIIFANDVDLTVSTSGISGEDDPRRIKIHNVCGKALASLEKAKHYVGFISNRAGHEIAAMAAESDIEHATIIGTYGHEIFYLRKHHPALGFAVIADRFHPYADTISDVLSKLQERTYAYLSVKYHPTRESNKEIKTKKGAIILQQKGNCTLFPFGLANVYNFNLVDPDIRKPVIDFMQETFYELMRQHMQRFPIWTAALLSIWGIVKDQQDPSSPDRYSLSFEPLIKQGKYDGMLALLQTVDKLAKKDKHRIGLILYAGDSSTDAEAMLAADKMTKIISSVQGDNESNSIESLGIWVKANGDEPRVRQRADIIVKGPDGYAELLNSITKLFQ